MDKAKKLLLQGEPISALERLKKLLTRVDAVDEWRVHELIGAAFHDIGDAEGAAQAYLNAAQSDTILRSQRVHFSNYIFALHYLPQVTAENLADAAKIYNSLYRDVEPLPVKNRRGKKIHVVYIAPHFLNSSSARFYESLLTSYDREKFFVTTWSLTAREDNFTKKIRRSVDGYFDISRNSFEESARDIQTAGADVLIDLGGHTDGGLTLQIAAYRPARVQISAIGYFDTTGLDAIDYFLTDNYLIADNQNYFAERLLTVDNAFAFQSDILSTTHNSLTTTIACLNNFMKITDEYLDCAAKILDTIPDTKMIFRDTTPLQSRQQKLAERIDRIGIPSERVEILCGDDNFYNDYAKIDLILDTFPYTGGAMTALALAMGVPVISLLGELHHSRIGADILRIAGLDSLIAVDVDDYIDKAVAVLRGDLNPKPNIGKLLDVRSFAANFYSEVMGLV